MSYHILTLTVHGPVYNVTGVERHRRKANSSSFTVDDLFAYGEAVCEAVRRLQRQAMAREGTPVSNKCYASGTAYSCGKKICKAIRVQHRNAFASGQPSDPKKMTKVAGDWFLDKSGELCRA